MKYYSPLAKREHCIKINVRKSKMASVSTQLERKSCTVNLCGSLIKISAQRLESFLGISVCSTTSIHTLSDKEIHQVFNFVYAKQGLTR